ncbi:L-ribulose-5-phosphate 4-epimerase [Candidatus Aerophobetes bacterium Ae_b3b]|nr:MAG: L-ribulose-5-phosphate 4-epimerase [Candidatus Aerophobetes bacterium Ae_b3b]
MLEKLRQEVWQMNLELPKNRLVTMTSGNVSGRDRGTNYVVIKPSGVKYEDLKSSDMVVVDLEGKVIEGELRPSFDTLTHLYVYRHRQDVNGIVHTHSNYATSFAALGEPIPVCLTAMADQFGGPIPVGAYARIGEEEIGKEIIRSIGESPAILMKNHGVFTLGPSPRTALKTAVMLEDLAKTVFLAMLRGAPLEIPEEEVKRAHKKYVEQYGQP